jgi:hypothetical protein
LKKIPYGSVFILSWVFKEKVQVGKSELLAEV